MAHTVLALLRMMYTVPLLLLHWRQSAHGFPRSGAIMLAPL
jgi:hypothetical protein